MQIFGLHSLSSCIVLLEISRCCCGYHFEVEDNIHLLGTGQHLQIQPHFANQFQSTPPAKGATFRFSRRRVRKLGISIHAPCEGGDHRQFLQDFQDQNFNPRPLRRGRPEMITTLLISCTVFQSTPPAKGATSFAQTVSDAEKISIHAPCEGGDSVTQSVNRSAFDFNPRPLRRGRLFLRSACSSVRHFNPRPLRRGLPCSVSP